MPMIFVSRYFSTPGAGGMALICAYELTKKPAYLAAAVQGANYSLGANADNLSYCTGIGDNAQHFIAKLVLPIRRLYAALAGR